MKKTAGILLFLSLTLNICPLFSLPALALEYDELKATSAILMDADTGQVLYDKNGTASPMYPASTTKIMTGMLALEYLNPSDILTVNASAVDEITYGSSHIALTYDEQLPVRDAMYALMLPSANDAANVLAEHVRDTQEEFARLMTERARELGAVNTNFTNAHGLHDDQHYTSAYDMALITSAAIQNPEFVRYFGTGRYTMPPTNLQSEQRHFTNQQYMLLEDMWVYNPYLIGGKVGYTNEAKHTMSSAATQNGRTLVAVVFESGKDEKFYDTQALFDTGFDNYKEITISAKEIAPLTVPILDDGSDWGEATFSLEEDLVLLIPKSANQTDVSMTFDLPDAFDRNDDIKAAMTLVLNGNKEPGVPSTLFTQELHGEFTMPDMAVWNTMETERAPRFIFSVAKHVYLPVGLLLGGALLVIICLSILQQRKRKRARAERLQRRMRYRQGYGE